jgi:protein-disulfide isomerase
VPFCRQAHRVVEALMEALPERVCFVFRNLPLTTLHPRAFRAAEAAEAAGAQGRFWHMHDMLFEHGDALERPDLESYAILLGLDLHAFQRDLRMHRFAERIHAEMRSGARSGVSGTPTFFVDGVRHEGPFDLHALMAAILERAPLPAL